MFSREPHAGLSCHAQVNAFAEKCLNAKKMFMICESLQSVAELLSRQSEKLSDSVVFKSPQREFAVATSPAGCDHERNMLCEILMIYCRSSTKPLKRFIHEDNGMGSRQGVSGPGVNAVQHIANHSI